MSDSNKFVMVVWADRGSSNLGVRALAEGSKIFVEKLLGQSDIKYWSYGDVGKSDFPKIGIKRLLLGCMSPRRYSPLAGCNALIDTNAGDSFTDTYGLRRLTEMSAVRFAAYRLGVPVIFSPQTIGPFNTRIGRELGKWGIRNATRVFARDSASAACAKELGAHDVVLSTDMVFLLDRPKVKTQDLDVVLNVSGLLWRSNPHVDNLKYQDRVISLILRLVSEGRNVSLCPHVFANDVVDEDSAAIEQLCTMLPLESIDVCKPLSLWDVRCIFASASIVIAARMHACLNALSVGTPAVAWAYSRKFEPLLKDVGWDCVVDLRNHNQDVEQLTLDYMAGSCVRGTSEVIEEANRKLLSLVRISEGIDL